MANTIRIKRSAVGGKVPTTSQLSLGELAINTTDGRLYTRKEVSGVASIVEIGAGGGISGPVLHSKRVLAENVTLASGYNGLSIDSVEISNGYTVEVPANAVWTIF